ncbi:MAG TPA: hypothetical protein VFY16_06250, partial [Gemmatimonadaceae bacterium]|nr:hypothetical protein [Gemmatimonadaceae bacterium]
GAGALRLVAAGATRIGTSAGVAMAETRGPGPRPLRELLGALDAAPEATAESAGAARGGP